MAVFIWVNDPSSFPFWVDDPVWVGDPEDDVVGESGDSDDGDNRIGAG